MSSDPSLKTMFHGLLDELTRLGRQEIALAKAEIIEDIDAAQRRLIAMIVGLLLGFCAVLILLQAIVTGLATQMPTWLASVIVALITGIVAFTLIKSGQADMNLTPKKTIQSLKRDKDVIAETVS